MKIRILAIGKLKRGPLFELIDDYKKRCRWPIQIIEIDHSTKSIESAQLLTHITTEDHVIILDEHGDAFSSQDFSGYIDKLQSSGKPRLSFIIGGAYGFEKNLKDKADKILAFGIQTWPHMFVRLMLVEQIYRAESILAGHPYHKE